VHRGRRRFSLPRRAVGSPCSIPRNSTPSSVGTATNRSRSSCSTTLVRPARASESSSSSTRRSTSCSGISETAAARLPPRLCGHRRAARSTDHDRPHQGLRDGARLCYHLGAHMQTVRFRMPNDHGAHLERLRQGGGAPSGVRCHVVLVHIPDDPAEEFEHGQKRRRRPSISISWNKPRQTTLTRCGGASSGGPGSRASARSRAESWCVGLSPGSSRSDRAGHAGSRLFAARRSYAASDYEEDPGAGRLLPASRKD